MKIEYFHASKYGNEAAVAEEFRRQATGNATVNVRHIREVTPTELPPADLYVFSSPGRMGKPIRGVRGFLKQLTLPPGTNYAILTTELAPRPPDKKSRLGPTKEQLAMWQRAIPIMNEILQQKGLVKIAEGKVYVNGLTGPLEDGWQKKVASFVAGIESSYAPSPNIPPALNVVSGSAGAIEVRSGQVATDRDEAPRGSASFSAVEP